MRRRIKRWFTELWRVRRIRAASARSVPQRRDLLAAAQALPERPRILILKLDHIGDFVLAMRGLLRIRETWPRAEITLVCGPWNVELAKQMDAFDRIVPFGFYTGMTTDIQPTMEFRTATFAMLDLRGPFDLAIDLRHGDDTRPLLESADAGIRAGYAAGGLKAPLELELPTGGVLHTETQMELLVEAIVDTLGPRSTHPIGRVSAPAIEIGATPYIVIAPGAGKSSSRWPFERFALLCRALAGRTTHELVLVGGPRDADNAHTIAAAIPAGRCRDLTGQTPIERLPAILSQAALYIGNDSGPTHMAAALGIPTICIFAGSADHRLWAPRGPNVHLLRTEIGCAPCDILRDYDCPIGLLCLTSITVDMVVEAAIAALSAAAARSGTSPDR